MFVAWPLIERNLKSHILKNNGPLQPIQDKIWTLEPSSVPKESKSFQFHVPKRKKKRTPVS